MVYCDDAGGLTFTLKSGASPDPVRGTLRPGQGINTGWADWQLQAAAVLPAAVGQTTFHPVKDAPPVHHRRPGRHLRRPRRGRRRQRRGSGPAVRPRATTRKACACA